MRERSERPRRRPSDARPRRRRRKPPRWRRSSVPGRLPKTRQAARRGRRKWPRRRERRTERSIVSRWRCAGRTPRSTRRPSTSRSGSPWVAYRRGSTAYPPTRPSSSCIRRPTFTRRVTLGTPTRARACSTGTCPGTSLSRGAARTTRGTRTASGCRPRTRRPSARRPSS